MKVKELGFTLVEMMAVIILLGVVSLIAIPQINKIIKNTRMSVFEDSAYGVIRSGEIYYKNREILGEQLIDTTFVFPEASGLEINGDVPKSGKMVVTSDGSIKLAISNGKYCARKDYNDSRVSVNEDINNCTLESVGTENPGGSGGSGSGDGTGGNTGTTQLITNLELSTTSVSVINGGTYQIEATITPTSATNKTLKYTSNNTSVATVSSTGLITGIAGGETTVTVTTTDGSNISKEIDVIVRQQISNVELDITSASIDVGESVIVNATITPSNAYIKTLKWESSNDSVATVNNGIITGVNPGVAVITATTQDGTAIENKINVTVKVYTITYNTDGGALPSDAITSYHAGTETFNLPTPTKTGYTLEGWYENEDLSGNKVTQIIKGTKENKVYYAKWAPNSYTYNIVYKSSSGIELGTGTIANNYGTTNTVSPNSYTGYTSPANQNIVWDSTTTKTITFTYTPIEYTITYNLNSGTQGSGAVTKYTIETTTFSLPTPTRKNYNFKGWHTSSSFSGSAVTQITKGSTGNKTYYANWEVADIVLVGGGVTPQFNYGTAVHTYAGANNAGTRTIKAVNDTIQYYCSVSAALNTSYINILPAVDLTNYKKVTVKYTISGSLQQFYIGLRKSQSNSSTVIDSGWTKSNRITNSASATLTYDVSDLSGEYYFGLTIHVGNETGTLTITSIIIE